MTHHPPAIEAIERELRERPQDWESWLVYADWLDEQGDERGQLVRWEHRLATEDLSMTARRRLERKVERAYEEGEREWLPGWSRPYGAILFWTCGFVRKIQFHKDTPWNEPFEALAAHPSGRLLTALDLRSCTIGGDGLEALIRSPALGRLTDLGLGHCSLMGQGGVLGAATSRCALVRLGLWNNHLMAQGLSDFLGSASLGTLSALDLETNFIRSEGIEILAGSDRLGALTELDIGNNSIGPEGARALARSTALPSLTELRLGHAGDIGIEGLEALVHSPALRSLTRLDLHGSGIRDEEAAVLAGATALGELVELNLDDNDIQAEGAAALARSTGFGKLQRLVLSDNFIGDDGARALARSTTLPSLLEVDVARSHVHTAEIEIWRALEGRAPPPRPPDGPKLRVGDRGAREYYGEA